MAPWWVKCLTHKGENWSSGPQNLPKACTVVHICNPQYSYNKMGSGNRRLHGSPQACYHAYAVATSKGDPDLYACTVMSACPANTLVYPYTNMHAPYTCAHRRDGTGRDA